MTRTLVMAVPWLTERAKRAVQLHRQLGAEIVWDEKQDPFETWMRMLGQAGDDPVICLEDDVRVADDWRERIETVIAEHEHDVIQTFSLRGADARLGSRYMAGSTYLMNQCHYLPRGAAADLREFAQQWYAEHRDTHPTGMDTCVSRWLVARRQRYWLEVPSLVQHEPWDSQIKASRARTRQSPTFQERSE